MPAFKTILFVVIAILASHLSFGQTEKIFLKFSPTEYSDKSLKKEIGDAFASFKKDGLSDKYGVARSWSVDVNIKVNRDENKNKMDLWIVNPYEKKPDPLSGFKFYLVHRIIHEYETAFDMERDASSTHDPVFLKTLVQLKLNKSHGELNGKPLSRHIIKESNDNKLIYTREIIAIYSLNEGSNQLGVNGEFVDNESLTSLIESIQ